MAGRSRPPPSAFRTGGLRPPAGGNSGNGSGSSSASGGGTGSSASAGASDTARRLSKTAEDFEQALRGSDTVLLREGLDIGSLGRGSSGGGGGGGGSAGHSPTASFDQQHHYQQDQADEIRQRKQKRQQQHLQPQHPHGQAQNRTRMRSGSGSHGSHSPGGAPRIALTRTASTVSSDDEDGSISSREVAPLQTRVRALPNFLGSDPAADAGRGEKRISLLRSAGTASSPDLATLVRKAKEKATAAALAATGGGGGGRGGDARGKEHQRQSHGHSRYGANPALGVRNLSPNHTKPDHSPSRSTSTAGSASTATTRQRSSTTAAPAGASSSTKGKLSKSRAQQDLSLAPTSSSRSPVSSDWITTNMRSRSDTVVSKVYLVPFLFIFFLRFFPFFSLFRPFPS